MEARGKLRPLVNNTSGYTVVSRHLRENYLRVSSGNTYLHGWNENSVHDKEDVEEREDNDTIEEEEDCEVNCFAGKIHQCPKLRRKRGVCTAAKGNTVNICDQVTDAAPCPGQRVCCMLSGGPFRSRRKNVKNAPGKNKDGSLKRKLQKVGKNKDSKVKKIKKRRHKQKKRDGSVKGGKNKRKKINKKKTKAAVKKITKKNQDKGSVEVVKKDEPGADEKFASVCKGTRKCKGTCIPESEKCNGKVRNTCGPWCKCCEPRGGGGGGGGGSGQCGGKCKGKCTAKTACKKGREWKEGQGCTGAWCGCCKKKKKKNSKKCKVSNQCSEKKGSCKKKCSKNEKPMKQKKLCAKKCRCCVPKKNKKKKCKKTDACKNEGGKCKNPKKCKSNMVSNSCDKGCVCCIKDVVCPQPNKCREYNGICSKTCSSNERELKDLCNTDNSSNTCKCCAPKCSQDSACTQWGGTCVDDPEQCSTESGTYTITGGCMGYNCVCCKPGVVCPQPNKCREYNGICSKTCSSNERELKDLCNTDSSSNTCKCCAPKCSQDSACTQWGGTCVDDPEQCSTESGTYTITGGCTGYSCVCCKPVSGVVCPQPNKCREYNGICSKTCRSNERELKDLCNTDSSSNTCKCCAPKCSQDSACTQWGGTCVDDPEQCSTESGTYTITGGCTGYSCVCCKPVSGVVCPQPNKCREYNGICSKTCRSNERELKDLCNTDSSSNTCKCCAPKCSQDSACTQWGGTCVDDPNQCVTEHGANTITGGCTGYSCVCCKPVLEVLAAVLTVLAAVLEVLVAVVAVLVVVLQVLVAAPVRKGRDEGKAC
ncbi:hypothetical protein O3P69_005955 [Scylla paramamosain]|uniref:Uncharacterized protein n=1 Tax=Scylla paramamosain TaxID=85552 RepID=A0AAW0U7D7_SCYPA